MGKSLNSILRSFVKAEKELTKFVEVTGDKAAAAERDAIFYSGEVTRAQKVLKNINSIIN